jgi:hypothetical protein
MDVEDDDIMSHIIRGSEMLLDVHHYLYRCMLYLVQVGDCWIFMPKTQYISILLMIFDPKRSHTEQLIQCMFKLGLKCITRITSYGKLSLS